MFNRNHRMKVLFAILIIVTAMAGCAKEPYRDSPVEESVATKDAPHTLDVFHIAFAPGSDETERTMAPGSMRMAGTGR